MSVGDVGRCRLGVADIHEAPDVGDVGLMSATSRIMQAEQRFSDVCGAYVAYVGVGFPTCTKNLNEINDVAMSPMSLLRRAGAPTSAPPSRRT